MLNIECLRLIHGLEHDTISIAYILFPVSNIYFNYLGYLIYHEMQLW